MENMENLCRRYGLEAEEGVYLLKKLFDASDAAGMRPEKFIFNAREIYSVGRANGLAAKEIADFINVVLTTFSATNAENLASFQPLGPILNGADLSQMNENAALDENMKDLYSQDLSYSSVANFTLDDGLSIRYKMESMDINDVAKYFGPFVIACVMRYYLNELRNEQFACERAEKRAAEND